MRIDDAPLHQERWRNLVESSFGERSASYVADKLEYVGFTLRGERRYRIRMTEQDAIALHTWLTEQLNKTKQPPLL